ncbi:hypothetical protein Tco_1490373 [Tanacetum coccineum]
MEAIEELVNLSDSMRQAAALLNDEDLDDNSSSNNRRGSTFLNVVALGNTISSCIRLATIQIELLTTCSVPMRVPKNCISIEELHFWFLTLQFNTVVY